MYVLLAVCVPDVADVFPTRRRVAAVGDAHAMLIEGRDVVLAEDEWPVGVVEVIARLTGSERAQMGDTLANQFDRRVAAFSAVQLEVANSALQRGRLLLKQAGCGAG